MQLPDLIKEMKSQEVLVATLRLGVCMQKEKDTAKYRRAKRQFSRIKTIVEQKRSEELLSKKSKSTVSTSANLPAGKAGATADGSTPQK
jgi:ribosomal protein L29